MIYLKWKQKVLQLWWSRRWGNQTLVFCVLPNPKRWCRVSLRWWEQWDDTGPVCVVLLTPEPAGVRPADKMNLYVHVGGKKTASPQAEENPPMSISLMLPVWKLVNVYTRLHWGCLCYSLRTGVCVFARRLKKKGCWEQKMEANTKTRL